MCYYQLVDLTLSMFINSFKGPILKNCQIIKSVRKYIKIPNTTRTANFKIFIIQNDCFKAKTPKYMNPEAIKIGNNLRKKSVRLAPVI